MGQQSCACGSGKPQTTYYDTEFVRPISGAPATPFLHEFPVSGQDYLGKVASICPQRLPISVAAFAVARRWNVGPGRSPIGETWQLWYTRGKEIGRGISAKVSEAEAKSTVHTVSNRSSWWSCSATAKPPCCGSTDVNLPMIASAIASTEMVDKLSRCSTSASGSRSTEGPRKVAIKCFKKPGSRAFKAERAALVSVGVHPNVLRLLESYEDCDGEDVLVLELCDSITVFELHASACEQGSFLSETLVVRLLRQVMLALEHIHACGVAHRDVKPENMLLHSVSLTEQRVELKLGDFGWAIEGRMGGPEGASSRAPFGKPELAGSLWYAPPELNPPPVDAAGNPCSADQLPYHTSLHDAGRSDMWSVGVVAYLLLVGHNPFAAAARQADAKAVENEVIRLVAMGRYDMTSPRWLELPADARDFIGMLLKPAGAARPSANEALRHPFLARQTEEAHAEPACCWLARGSSWGELDGLQQLAWVAVARAISESELSQEVVSAATRASRAGGSLGAGYLWELARELSSAPYFTWLRRRGVWPEVLRLAFRYLDVNGDGVLSASDITSHLVPLSLGDARSAARQWVAQWSSGPPDVADGLRPGDLCAALLASSSKDAQANDMALLCESDEQSKSDA